MNRVTNDDALFGYRLQLFDLPARTSVSEACRTMGMHRSTYYYRQRQVDRHGLEILRPRERRRPAMPNQLPRMVEERILAFSIAYPGFGPRRVAAALALPQWGGLRVSANGVWRCLRRHGLSTRTRRLALVAGYRAPYEPPREQASEPHIEVERPGELIGMDCFYVGRLRGTEGAVWQLTAIDIASSFAWAELVVCRQRNPGGRDTSRLARRVAHELRAAGWRLERVLCDNGQEFKSELLGQTLERLGAQRTHIRAGRPQTNGHLEALHKTILDECWRPASARYLQPRLNGLKRDLDTYLSYYNFERVHTGRLTRGRVPADIVYGAHKMEAR
jgi:transposase InsO family protein